MYIWFSRCLVIRILPGNNPNSINKFFIHTNNGSFNQIEQNLSKKLNEICQDSTFDRDIVINLINMLKEKYDIPSEYSNDLLTLRKKFDNEPVEILYCFTTVLAPKK